MKKIFFFVSTAVFLGSCTPKTTETVEEVKKSEFPSAEVEEGSSLYAANCGKCHDLPVEAKYSQDQWKKIVPPMAQKAKLDATQENKVLQYVLWKSN